MKKTKKSARRSTGGQSATLASAILPATWHVYGFLELSGAQPWPSDGIATLMAGKRNQTPDSIRIDGRSLKRRTVRVENGRLDLIAAFSREAAPDSFPGYYQEQTKSAVILIPFELDETCAITFGFGAEWVFGACLDGMLLSDSFATKGNAKPPPTNRDLQTTITVAKGRHILSIRCSSSPQGFVMCASASRAVSQPALPISPKTQEWLVTERDVAHGRKLLDAQARARIGQRVEMFTDIEYGRAGDRSLRLDLLRLKGQSRKPLPVVMWIHGGGWAEGIKDWERGNLYSHFVASGDYIGVTLTYRLSGQAIWPAQIHDCKAAIRWIRANAEQYGMDPERIGVAGVSAGGHLAAMLGVTGDVKELEGNSGNPGYSSRVSCVLDYCGPAYFEQKFFDTNGLYNTCFRFVSRLLGAPPAKNPKAARSASPITHVSADSAAFLIVHGSLDTTVKMYHSDKLAEALRHAGASVTYIRSEGSEHGNLTDLKIGRRVLDFFDRHLRGKKVMIPDDPVITHVNFGG